MAQSMSPVLPPVLLPPNPVTRSNSTASTNSSASSAVSLRRRSRTRTRSSTTVRRGKSIGPPTNARGDQGDGQPAVTAQPQVPPLPTRSHPQPANSGSVQDGIVQELRVPGARERAWSTVHIRDVPPEALRGRQAKSDAGSAKQVKARARGMSLPRSAFRTAVSSDESSVASPRTPNGPFDAPFVRPGPGNSQHFRDSVISSSSSLYPKSTSTESYPDSSLRSIGDKDREMSPFGAPRIVTSNAEFDVDDVSYRLRLLVNNSYFLPPAHSKPSPLALTSQKFTTEQKPVKSPAPTFFDFFRMGKSKSKPSTPLAQSPPAIDPATGPILRTTSDSSTASGRLPHSQSQSQPETPPHPPVNQAPPTRVVVLREQMDDLIEAAKQAERDIKLRGDGRKAKSQTAPSDLDDVIDPTDAVDLPPPPSAYPFAVQTSALHGLGPGESLGAELLADALPPSPGMWSMSTEEDTWRKAILQEAVSLSLNESPERSFSSLSSASPDPQTPSFRPQGHEKAKEPTSPPAPKKPSMIGQRIMHPEKIVAESIGGPLSPLSAVQSLPSPVSFPATSPKESVGESWKATLHLPRRAETPAVHSPLTPPPMRRQLSHPQYSQSSSQLSRARGDSEQSVDSETLHILRKTVSDPRLSFRHEESRTTGGVTSPPPESLYQRMMSPPIVEPQQSLSGRPSMASMARRTPFSDDDSMSYATAGDVDIDDDAPRPSMTLSIPTIGRPSMSDCSNPSPTTSAFQDAVFGSCRSPSPLLFRRSHMGMIGTSTVPPSPVASTSESSRLDAMSPPPRPSSAVEGPTILPPPPRTPAVKPFSRPSTSSGASASAHSSQSRTHLRPATERESEGESSIRHSQSSQSPTSSVPLAERRGIETLQSLQIPSDFTSPALHSAPAPASPAAFFDQIQSHPNAMDDLETSDESDDEDVAAPVIESPPEPVRTNVSLEEPRKSLSTRSSLASSRSSRSTRPSFMRLGNHSTPQLSPKPSIHSFDVPDPKMPIGHIAEQGTFFTSRSRKKSGKSQKKFPMPVHSKTLDFPVRRRFSDDDDAGPSTGGDPYQQHWSSPRRPATSSAAEGSRPRAGQRESILKFDGMLAEHIASERDTIKRITSNLSSSRS